MSVGSVAKRSGWIFLALLFTVTGLGAGIYGFWQYTHPPAENKPESSKTDVSSNNSNKPDNTQTDQLNKLKGQILDGFTPVEKVTQLKIEDKKVGTGKVVKSGDTVTAHYTGAVAASGLIFESSLDSGKPFTSPLSNLIKGWQQGIPGMKEGGERRLIIPASLAYGDNPPPGIPVNADLVFDIVLISVK